MEWPSVVTQQHTETYAGKQGRKKWPRNNNNNKSETKLTASVLKRDQITQKVQNNIHFN